MIVLTQAPSAFDWLSFVSSNFHLLLKITSNGSVSKIPILTTQWLVIHSSVLAVNIAFACSFNDVLMGSFFVQNACLTHVLPRQKIFCFFPKNAYISFKKNPGHACFEKHDIQIFLEFFLHFYAFFTFCA